MEALARLSYAHDVAIRYIPQDLLIVNGARHHAENIEELVKSKGRGKLSVDCKAIIQPDPENPIDPVNAVKVVVDGIRVGYISAEKAPSMRAVLQGEPAELDCTLFWNGDPERDYSFYAVQLFS